jgi:uncharacterized protein YndB with AHSA1/START domain
MPDILHRVGIKAAPDTVYKALTESEGLAGWWTKNTKASPAVGAVNQFRFNGCGFNDMKVVELVPGQRVKWQCVDGAKEWIGTELTFDLKPEKEFTILLFCATGLERATRVHALLQHQMGCVFAQPKIAL